MLNMTGNHNLTQNLIIYKTFAFVFLILSDTSGQAFYNQTRDNTHMTSKKLSNFQDPPPPVNLSPKFFHLLDFGLPISNEPSSPNDNQSLKRKHDRRMTMLSTIFKGWLHCLTSEANISCQQYIVWLSMISGHGANPIFFNKKIQIGHPEHSLHHNPTSCNITFTEEIFNGKIHFLCNVVRTRLTSTNPCLKVLKNRQPSQMICSKSFSNFRLIQLTQDIYMMVILIIVRFH